MSSSIFTDDYMINKVRWHLDIISRYTKENELDETDKFLYQLLSEYLQLKEKELQER